MTFAGLDPQTAKIGHSRSPFPYGKRVLPRIQLLLGICCLLLAGCATTDTEPRIVTKIVEVPVAVRCALTIPDEPSYADSKAALDAAPGIFDKVRILLIGREQREAYKNEVKAALIGCAG